MKPWLSRFRLLSGILSSCGSSERGISPISEHVTDRTSAEWKSITEKMNRAESASLLLSDECSLHFFRFFLSFPCCFSFGSSRLRLFPPLSGPLTQGRVVSGECSGLSSSPMLSFLSPFLPPPCPRSRHHRRSFRRILVTFAFMVALLRLLSSLSPPRWLLRWLFPVLPAAPPARHAFLLCSFFALIFRSIRRILVMLASMVAVLSIPSIPTAVCPSCSMMSWSI